MNRVLRAALCLGGLALITSSVAATPAAATPTTVTSSAAQPTAAMVAPVTCKVVAGRPALTASGKIRAVAVRKGCTGKALFRIRLKKSVVGPDRVVKSGSKVAQNVKLVLTVKCARGTFYTVATDHSGHTSVSRKARLACPKPPAPPGGGAGTAIENEVVRLTNVERARAGCGALTHDARLRKAAFGHSADMSARNYFDHDSQDGRSFSQRITAAGFRFTAAAENIAKGQRSAAEVVRAWMNSPGHRQNIVNCTYTHIGVGYVAASGPYWTQDFGRP